MSSNIELRLGEVYGATSITDLSKTYDDWATSYDEDMLSLGYAHPAIICGLTSRTISDFSAPILDVGVGTGAIGTFLTSLGYSNLHGLDMSPGMLAKAQNRGCYASLTHGVLGQALALADASFAAIISTGTFTKGHAPASGMVELSRLLRPGGFLIFTLGISLWEAEGFAAQFAKLPDLKPVWTSRPYAPMPFSKTESHYLTSAQVFQKA